MPIKVQQQINSMQLLQLLHVVNTDHANAGSTWQKAAAAVPHVNRCSAAK
jgi:hypothetical protein